MSPGARGLSICYALLVNAASAAVAGSGGVRRRPAVILNNSVAAQHRSHQTSFNTFNMMIAQRTALLTPIRAVGGFAALPTTPSKEDIVLCRIPRRSLRGYTQSSRSAAHGWAPILRRPASSTSTGSTESSMSTAATPGAGVPVTGGSIVGCAGEDGVVAIPTRSGAEPEQKVMKVTLLSGFLGAGKTTLMRNVLRQAREEELALAVIVNDMADVNIDAQMLASGGLRREAERGSKGGLDFGADVRSVGGDGGDGVVAMQGGCICCTLRDDLLLEVEAIAREGRHDHLIIESTGISDPTPVAEAFASSIAAADAEVEFNSDIYRQNSPASEGETAGNSEPSSSSLLSPSQPPSLYSLDTLVTVVDSTSFLDEVRKADELEERGLEAEVGDTRTIADLLVSQVEFANVILLNKADLVSDDDEMDKLEAVVRRLNPLARVIRTVSSSVGLEEVVGTGEFDLEEASQAAGWVQALNEESQETHHAHNHDHHDDGVVCRDVEEEKKRSPAAAADAVGESGGDKRRHRGETFGIGSFTFHARRPFHPDRLMAFVMEHLPSVLRSKGFVWLATRHDTAGVWNQAGGSFATEYGGPWETEHEEDQTEQKPIEPHKTVNGVDGVDVDDDVGTILNNNDDYVSNSGDSRSMESQNSPRSELVFIGLGMNEEVLTMELRGCLLTDDEMVGGPAKWERTMVDPFPPWQEEEEIEELSLGNQ